MSVRHALRDSVNLVFIRLMRDVVYHHLYKPEGIARWLENPDDTKRKEYLQRFADKEGQVYLQRFYAKYQDKSEEESLALLTERVLASLRACPCFIAQFILIRMNMNSINT